MRFLVTALLSASTITALAQENTSASAEPLPWYRPRHLIAQTAGGMGMVAVGAGYSFWRDRAEADLLLGYVPEKYAGSTLSIATAKFLYSPFTVPLSEKLQLRPLTVGVYVSYTHGLINDEAMGQYTKGYYWFSTDTRVGPLLGGRLSYLRQPSPQGHSRRISAYYELGTNDLYLFSIVPNANYKSLSPLDLLTLGLGVKMEF
ncbi:hypothetical protein KBK19_00145 [Microvirga sp. STR05]|uniref:Outer membrane protein beta-barrel domain-containing protein n=1 Tax=Hymenobacter duratus TaxID=2771356 RepID=A0ABR8JA93_9BACT|nr:hypothetical protein [Hymenobacter duratus]MBD2713437.1 hypothetical protein [Hymenobacter duratus]MBR7948339.1 hypothetical protein [Microvirga sp. STR05]